MIQEKINVFSGMKTDTWQGKAEYFSGADENKTLKITAEMVENWRSSTFYVGTHGKMTIIPAHTLLRLPHSRKRLKKSSPAKKEVQKRTATQSVFQDQ